MYYLRTRAAEKAIQFTVNKSKLINQQPSVKDKVPTDEEVLMCSLQNKENCVMCSG